LSEDLLHQVVLPVLDPAAQLSQEHLRIADVTQAQRHQAETYRPPLGLLQQVGQRLRADAQPGGFVEKRCAILCRKAEVLETHLRQLTVRPHLGHGQRRIAPGDDHEVQGLGRMGHEYIEQIVSIRRGSNTVVVVQSQHEVSVDRVQLIGQAAAQYRNRRQRGSCDQG